MDDETMSVIAWGLRRDRPADECNVMVIGECLVVGRRTMRGDGRFMFEYTFADYADFHAAGVAAAKIVQGVRSEGFYLFESSKVRKLDEHPDYARRWLEGVRSGRNDEGDLYKVYIRIINGSAPLAAVMA